jgi:hypothetical protein
LKTTPQPTDGTLSDIDCKVNEAMALTQISHLAAKNIMKSVTDNYKSIDCTGFGTRYPINNFG